MNQATGGIKDRRPEQARRLAALERARALGERIRAERPAHDVDSVELLRQLREARTDELLGLR
jgi:hypothetical protein